MCLWLNIYQNTGKFCSNAKGDTMMQKLFNTGFKKFISVLFVFVFLFSFTTASAETVEDKTTSSVAVTSEVASTEVTTTSVNTDTAASSSYSNKYNVKTTKALYLRKSASSSSSKIKLINKGSTLYLVANSSGSWVKVKDSTGTQGYAPSRYLNKGSGSLVSVKCTTNDSVNLRSGAGSKYSVVTTVPKGKTLTVSSNSNYNWAKVTYSGKSGYVSSSYVSFVLKRTSTSFSNEYNVTATKKLYIKKGAGDSYSNVKLVNKGGTLYVTANSSGSWVKVKDSTGTEGYFKTRYLNKGSGSKVTMKCKTTADVNMRKGAGTSYSVITVIPKGTTVTLSNNSNYNWGKVSYNSKSGYISSSYGVFKFTIPTTETVVKDGSLGFSSSSKSAYKGIYYQVKVSNKTGESVKWSSDNTGIAKVSGNGIVYGKKTGTVTITAKTSKKTASCKVKIKNPSKSVNISNKTYTTYAGKTLYLTSSSSVTWSSSDKTVATVSGGIVTCKKAGTVVIYAKTTGGYASCFVTVKSAEAVRFTYANPNSAPLNSTVKFVAITDTKRTDVKFVVKKGSKSYNVKATSKKKSSDTYIWTGSKKMTGAGEYSIVAYSKKGGKWSKSTGSYGKSFVTSVTSNTATSCEERHASNSVIDFISNYEGLLSKAEYDPLTSFPCLTVGYGRVIYAGENFYNNMTKEEAFAYLVDSVETDGYVSKVNQFLINNNIKFNQRHFDALVTFVYNCGYGILSNDNDIINLLLNTYPSSESNSTTGKTTASCALRSGAGSSYDKVKTLAKGAKVTLLSASLYNKNWYKVKDSKGKIGYMSYKYLKVTSYNKKGTRDLKNTIKKNFVENVLVYHHAGGSCYAGLLYRRIDETEMFYQGDYTRDGEKNKTNLSYTCYKNSNFGC
jgi:uncharacterized protein YgiM (DUF1202 family)/GH24 family phage-related lysozyme (muramidase)